MKLDRMAFRCSKSCLLLGALPSVCIHVILVTFKVRKLMYYHIYEKLLRDFLQTHLLKSPKSYENSNL